MRMGKRLYSLVMFLVVAIIGGLLAAGLVVPIAGMATDTTTSMVESLDQLPAELETPPQSERSRLLNADGSLLAYFYNENRVYKELKDISPIMQKAQVAIEDHRFYEHGAMDLQGTLRALVSTSQGNTQGGSSLTQQYVRLVLVENAEAKNDKAGVIAAKENTVARKIRELRYAIAIEEKFSKDEILQNYLNIAYYGDGAYGVEAAAKHYFGVSAAKLDLAQSAMLAGLVRNPNATNPVSHVDLAIERRNNVLDRMLELKLITSDEAAAAKAVEFDQSKVKDYLAGCANSKFPFVCDYAYRTLLKTPSLGSTEEERKQLIYRGGLTIMTQIDPAAQKKAEKTIANYVSAKDPVVSVITMMEPKTGLIRAMAQNRSEWGNNWKKGQTNWNYAVGADMGGADGYQGGSTFKAFVAAAALEENMGVNFTVRVKRSVNYQNKIFSTCNGDLKVRDDWTVDNPESGTMNLLQGTKYSVNNYYVALEQAVGLCAVTNMAKRLGLKASDGRDFVETEQVPSFTLGIVEVTPLSMVEAYGTFANRGVHCSPIILKSIKGKDGAAFDVPTAGCKRVLSEEVADAVNKVFQGPYTPGGTAYTAKVPGYTMAGKTGTVPKNKAVWTVGYTPDLVGAAVISYDNNKNYRKFWKGKPSFLRYVKLPASGRWLSGFSGNNAGANLLKPAMTAALADIEERTSFVEPPAEVLRGQTVGIPSCAGMGAAGCAATLRRAGFSSFTYTVKSDEPKGTFLGTNPSGGAPKGSQIGLMVSQGPKKKEEPTPEPSASASPQEKVKEQPRR